MWVDPLDGTKDFVNGNLASVTVLIGLTIDEHSRFGIVHNPFSASDNGKGATFFGSAEHGCFTVPYEHTMSTEDLLRRPIQYLPPFDPTENLREDHEIRVAASLNHFRPVTKEVIESLHPAKVVRLGGAGHKCLNLVMNRTDSWVHPVAGLGNWDLCAPESLVKSMGGYATDIFG